LDLHLVQKLVLRIPHTKISRDRMCQTNRMVWSDMLSIRMWWQCMTVLEVNYTCCVTSWSSIEAWNICSACNVWSALRGNINIATYWMHYTDLPACGHGTCEMDGLNCTKQKSTFSGCWEPNGCGIWSLWCGDWCGHTYPSFQCYAKFVV
jgi:hypothetical protein